MQIILASQNKNKLKELSTIFQINLSKHSLVSPRKFLNVIEDKETIKENAEKKTPEEIRSLFAESINDGRLSFSTYTMRHLSKRLSDGS